jgi:hypothetical protein
MTALAAGSALTSAERFVSAAAVVALAAEAAFTA